MTISYLEGDATSPGDSGNRIIAHVCNDVGAWGKGFVVAISRKWKEPERVYRSWYAERAKNDFGLGAVRLVQVEVRLWIANMVAQHGLRRSGSEPPIRYDALENCLERLRGEATRLAASVHMPRIGTGLAGGAWEKIEPIIQRTLSDEGISVTVYDLPP